jgi:hypothetical protein
MAEETCRKVAFAFRGSRATFLAVLGSGRIMRFCAFPFWLLLFGVLATAGAGCEGRNLIDALPAAERAALVAAADAAPFARGNLWQARRGAHRVTLVGTFHLDDPRHDETLARIAPLIAGADRILVEAGPGELAALTADITGNPALMFDPDGPTLPERLPRDDWQRVVAALRAAGIPPFLGAKMRPAWLGMMLSVPTCATRAADATTIGLDGRIIEAASRQGIPIGALEPHDTLLRIMAGFDEGQQQAMLEMALAQSGQGEDSVATAADSYFAGQSRLIWEYTRQQALRADPRPPAAVEADVAALEETLILSRNRAWVPVIAAAAAEGPLLAAFGALHLSGRDGVLDLLARSGWTVTPLGP